MRLCTIVASITAHVAVLVLLVIVPLVAVGALPSPHAAIEFTRVSAAELPEVPPPPRGGERTPAVAPRAAAPTEAPDRIQPEMERPAPPTPGIPIDGPAGIGPAGFPGGEPLLNLPGPPPPPKPREPVRPGGDIRVPQKIRHVAPVYPPIALSSRVEGTVILEAVLGENGRIRDLRVLRSIALLDRAAMDAVRQWQFTPTLLNGVPVPVVMTVTVTFQLK
jgi:periplasmic protein TonB